MKRSRVRRLLLLALAAGLAVTVVRLATADAGGVYDPELPA